MNSRLFKATIYLLLNTGLTSIVGFLFWRVASQYYTDLAEVGKATTLVAITAVSTVIATSGINPHIMLSVSNNGEAKTFSSKIVSYQTISGLASATISFIILLTLMLIPNFYFVRNPIVVLIVVAMSYAVAASSTIDFSLLALGRSGVIPAKNLGGSLVKTIILFAIAVLLGFSVYENVVISTLIGILLFNLVGLRVATRRTWATFREIKSSFADISRKIGYHQFTGLGQALPPLLAPLIITGMVGTQNSAIFSIVWLVGAAFFTIAPSVVNALLSDAANKDITIINHKIRMAALLSFSLLIPAITFVAFFNNMIMGFFGSQYKEGALLLFLFTLAAIPDALVNLSVAYLRLRGNLKPALILTSFIGISITLLVALLINDYGLNVTAFIWITIQSLGFIGISSYLYGKYRKGASN
jgi:O-antigen/teichoic acid export membrane protein